MQLFILVVILVSIGYVDLLTQPFNRLGLTDKLSQAYAIQCPI